MFYEEKGCFVICYLGDVLCLNVLVEGVVLINIVCGVVVDNMVLSWVFDSCYDLFVVLDVWEGEFFINW